VYPNYLRAAAGEPVAASRRNVQGERREINHACSNREYFVDERPGELDLKAVSIYFNAIDLTNVRQTRFEPLVRTSLGPGGNPISEVWAPLAGRTVTVGIKRQGRGY
jgi:hypothetical protein